MLKQICVFCGASPGSDPVYIQNAKKLGRQLAEKKIGLVYGGGSVGMMGVLARSVLDHSGMVTGVITKKLFEMEVGFSDLPELKVVGTMHERKALMTELSDGFIAMPGGFGTLDEMFEVLTWGQLGIHSKPCGFLNVKKYFEKLLAFVDHMHENKFITSTCREHLLVSKDPELLIEKMFNYKPHPVDKGKWAKELSVESQSITSV